MPGYPSYSNGGALSRGEFVAHMERVDRSFVEIGERLDSIDEKLDRPGRIWKDALRATGGRALLIAAAIAVGYFSTNFGVPAFPF